MRRIATTAANGGFTLIESLLSLTVFALILAIGYESIVSTAHSRKLITTGIDRQQTLRATHRTLSNAIYSNGPITGLPDTISIDLRLADSPWLSDINSIVFKVNEQEQLVAYVDSSADRIVLMNGLSNGRFVYHGENGNNNSWQSSQRPQWIELSWIENGSREVWRFLAQI